MKGTNILAHTSDSANYIKVDPTNTPFTATTLQACLEQIDQSALFAIPTAPYANNITTGSIRLATTAEIIDEADDILAITPKKLYDYKTEWLGPTEEHYGWTQTNWYSELAFNDDSKSITNLRFNTWLTEQRVSSTTKYGIAPLSTTAQAIAGTNNTTWMTSRQVLNELMQFAIQRKDATDVVYGGVRIATNDEVLYDKRNLLITPYNLNYKQASTETKGAFKTKSGFADSELNSFIATPATIGSLTPTDSRYGFVAITNNLTTNNQSALTANQGKVLSDGKIGQDGGTITGTLKIDHLYAEYSQGIKYYYGWGYRYQTSTKTRQVIDAGMVTDEAVLEARPVGSLYLSASSQNPSSIFGGSWTAVKGRTLVGAGSTKDARNETRSFQANTSSGEFNCLLTQSQMAEHKHSSWGEAYNEIENVCVEYNGGYWNGHRYIPTCTKYETKQTSWLFGIDTARGKSNRGSDGSDTNNYFNYTEPKGGNKPHNNMQPYKAIYIWRRTK